MYLLLLALSFIAFYFYCKRNYSYWRDRGVPQTNPVWVLGDEWKSIMGIQNIIDSFQKIYDQFPKAKYCGYYAFWDPRIVVRDPDLIKQITIKDFDHFVDHTQLIDIDHEKFWSRNLFALEGQKWKDSREKLTPSFTGSKMRAMLSLISDCSENFVKFFAEKNEKVLEIDLADAVTRFTNDAIATTAFGLEIDSLKNPNNDFYITGQKMLQMNLERILKLTVYQVSPFIYKLFKFQFFTSETTKFYGDLVREIMRVREEKGIIRPDVIHLLMETRKANNERKNIDITDDDIVSHAFLFFLGGLDTVSSGLTSLLYELMVQQDIQDKLRHEIMETKKRHEGKTISNDVLNDMKYMDMVLSETFRKWSPMIQMNRKCTKSYVLEAAYPGGEPVRVEKGTTLIIPTINMHRDPDLFPDPMKFDPERFNEENKANIHPYAYLPFGAGQRNCIGMRFSLMEMKAFVFNLLSVFQVVPTEKTQIPLKILETSFSPKPKGKLIVGLKKIE